MNILLTGVAGFIASHLAERLIVEGHEVLGIDSFDNFYDPALKWQNIEEIGHHESFELLRGDIRDSSLLFGIQQPVDAIIHIAARAGVRPSIRRPQLYYDVNVNGTLQLLEFARERGVKHVLFASSSSVYGNNEKVPFSEADRVDNPISPYAATKKAAELLCHSYNHLYGLTCLCLRFFTVYGPRQRPDLAIRKFARLLVEGEEIPMFGDGSTQRDYTYIDDIVDGVLGGLRWAEANPGAYEIVNLGESRTISLKEMIRVVSEEMGVEPRIRQFPMQPGDVERTYADISRARSLLGYNPRWEFREGVREFVKWFRGQPAG